MANNALHSLVLDVYNSSCKYESCVYGEVNSRFLSVQFKNNDTPYDVTGLYVDMYMKKTDNTEIFVNGTIQDAINGIVLFGLTSQMSAEVGKYGIVFKIYGSNPTSDLRVLGLTLEVLEGNADNGIEASNDFSALQTLIGTVNQYDNRIVNLEIGKISSVKVNNTTLTPDSNYSVNVLCATPEQGIKADNAVQSNQMGVANGIATTDSSNKVIQQLSTTNINSLLSTIYPVGSIYLSMNSTNPNIFFGGTWTQISQGKMLIGVDTNDTDFNAAEKTGGEKTHTSTIAEMPKHKFHVEYSNTGKYVNLNSGGSNYGLTYDTNGKDGRADLQTNELGGDQPHNNMPPYITCYMWQRTA